MHRNAARPSAMAMTLALIAMIAVLLPVATPAGAQPEDTTHWEFDVPSLDGTILDIDVIRTEGTPVDEPQPVILVVSPYTLPEGDGPSSRFDDFFEATGALEQGYTYAIATMRGFGQSEGCSDWGGPGEQMDVVAAVEWAAEQEWSNGNVALLGKSYDGWTGLMGMANQPDGLAAVISQEPVFDGYRYLYDDGIRFANSLVTPTSFMTLSPPTCAVEFYTAQQDDRADSAFWQQRELINASQGSDVPLFLMQGFLERNTKPDGAFAYWEGIEGPKRAWFGQFDHVRGTDAENSPSGYAVGRADWAEQMMIFLDAYLKEDAAAEQAWLDLPQVEVQDNQGRYRGEDAWPPADAVVRTSTINGGAYTDNGLNFGSPTGALVSLGTAPVTGDGIWSISQPLPGDRHLAGEPVLDLDLVVTAPRTNVVGNVYDIAPDGTATLVSRGADMIRLPGLVHHRLEMYGQDWVFAEGHRIGVLISGSNAEWWVHVPTQSPVAVIEAFAELPLLDTPRTDFDAGGFETSRLRQHNSSTFTVPAPVITLNETPFNVG